MRRKDREITDFEKMLEVVDRCQCCRLGLVDNGEAYIVPLNFGYARCGDQLTLYFHGAREGRKADLLKTGASVSFEMDCAHEIAPMEQACSFSFHYRSVMGRGQISLADTAETKAQGLQTIMAHYSGKNDWDFPAPVLDQIHVIRLDVTQWSCKVNE